ncbi:MAG: M20 family metallopeptidase [Bacteroidetes bacterium]|nr:M20 family metallopeptidase [Bacteroidota bacterium]
MERNEPMTENMDLQDQITKLSEEYLGTVRAYRHHLHMHPELSFEEYKTSAYIQETLERHGMEVTSGIAGTGLMVRLVGKGAGKVVALRADMDALPIQETNEVSYRSMNDGVMHACGHDVHSSSLMGAALILNQLKEKWTGEVRIIFQPGEERLPGGASLMIAEGVLTNPDVDVILGQHVFPELPSGMVGFKPGMYMASADEIYLKVKGKGGHGAMPHLNIDPVLISAHVLTALQQVVSRRAKATTPSVLSFGSIHGNGSTNVIPDEVKIEGTFRTFDEAWRDEAHRHIEQIAKGTAQSMGGDCEVKILKGYPYLMNHETLTARCTASAERYLGKEHVVELPLRMTAEDFAYYSHEVPACFYRLGTAGKNGQFKDSVHTSTFDIDEDALITGMGLMAFLATELLK